MSINIGQVPPIQDRQHREYLKRLGQAVNELEKRMVAGQSGASLSLEKLAAQLSQPTTTTPPATDTAPPSKLLLSRIAGQALSAHRVVFQDDADNRVRYADPQADSISEVLGITTTAAPNGEIVYVQTDGELASDSFLFTPGPVFVGANGTLQQTTPNVGAVLQVGVAITPKTILIRIQQPIY